MQFLNSIFLQVLEHREHRLDLATWTGAGWNSTSRCKTNCLSCLCCIWNRHNMFIICSRFGFYSKQIYSSQSSRIWRYKIIKICAKHSTYVGAQTLAKITSSSKIQDPKKLGFWICWGRVQNLGIHIHKCTGCSFPNWGVGKSRWATTTITSNIPPPTTYLLTDLLTYLLTATATATAAILSTTYH